MLRSRLRFGIFMAPYHSPRESPTTCFERDRELVQWLDELGFDEAWVGEHHSAGYEIISSPELFIADLAARTRQIRLGTGVVSLPYHSPLMVAERMNQLDHLTRGRAMLGVGPGLLPSDAMMLGIDPREQRRMMGESLDVILRLLRGEVVTEKTDWFELRDAKLHLAPYSRPHLEVAVAASVTPSGPRTAGRYGISMLSPAATTQGGFSALAYHWGIVEETAARARTARRPRSLARRRLVPRRRDARAGAARRDVRARRLPLLLPEGGRAARHPRDRHARGVPRRHDGVRRRGRRHARRPDRADRAARGAVGRLRRLPLHQPRLGQPRRRHGAATS